MKEHSSKQLSALAKTEAFFKALSTCYVGIFGYISKHKPVLVI